MKDLDFIDCEFIDQNMCFVNYFDFCRYCYSIKKLYLELDHNGKRFYKWYIYANIHMEECYKNAIWDFLNSDDVQDYMELIEKRQKYKII